MTRLTITFLSVVASLALAGPASAKGGSSAPPVPDTDPCEAYWDLPTFDDGSSPLVNRSLGGCVIVRASLSGLRLDRVVVLPGWTYEVKANGDGSNSRVQVDFTHTATGGTSSVRVEAGKTVIR